MRITTVLFAITAACAAIPSTSSMAAQVEWEGTYVDHCVSSRATCSFDVKRAGRGYKLTWVANDRTGQDRYCRFTADLVPATSETIRKHLGRALIGSVAGGGASVLLTVDGDRAILKTTGGHCRSPVGQIDPAGRYDREYIDY